MQCALGLSQLKRLPQFVKRRAEIAEKYQSFFKSRGDVDVPVLTTGAESSWHLYPLRLRLENLSIDRTQFLRALHAENIGANVHYIPVYWHPYYQKIGFKRGLCPIAEAQYVREISIPLFASMTDEDVHDVCVAVEKLLDFYSR